MQLNRAKLWPLLAASLTAGCGGGGSDSIVVDPLPTVSATVVYSAGAADAPSLYAVGRRGALDDDTVAATRWALAPDGSFVVALRADGRALRRLPLTGGMPQTLTPDLPAGSAVTDFQLDPAGTTLAYVADAQTTGIPAVYIVPAVGGASRAMAGSGPALPQGLPPGAWSPDGRYLLLTRRDNGSGTGTASLGVDLHDRQADTTTPFFERPATDTMLDAQWSPDGMHWILRSRTEETGATRNRLFVAEVGTPGIERVFYTGMSPDPTFHDHGPYQALPDGSGVLYSGGFFGSAPRQALRVGLWDALQTSISTYGFPRAGTRVLDLALTPDAVHVVYLADETDGVVQLSRRSRNVDEAGVRLNAALPGGRHVLSMALSPDGTQLLYVTSSAADAVRDGELYRVALDAPEQVQRLGSTGTAAVDVRQARFLPDGSGAVFLAEGGEAVVAALYHVAFDTPAAIRLLSVGSPAGEAVRAFALR